MTLKIVKMYREAKPYEKSALIFATIVCIGSLGSNILAAISFDGFEFFVLSLLCVLILLTGGIVSFLMIMLGQQVKK